MYLQSLGRQYEGYCQAAICSSADCEDAYKVQSGLVTATRVGASTAKPNTTAGYFHQLGRPVLLDVSVTARGQDTTVSDILTSLADQSSTLEQTDYTSCFLKLRVDSPSFLVGSCLFVHIVIAIYLLAYWTPPNRRSDLHHDHRYLPLASRRNSSLQHPTRGSTYPHRAYRACCRYSICVIAHSTNSRLPARPTVFGSALLSGSASAAVA